MSEKKDKPFKIYLRLLRYVLPYKKFLASSISATVFYSVFSGASIYLILPLLNTLFSQTSPQMIIAPANAPIFDRVKISAENLVTQFVFGGTKSNALLKICVVIVAAFFLRNIFGYAQSYFMAFVEQGLMRDIRNGLYRKIQDLSIGYFTSERTGSLISRITNDVFVINGGVTASFVTMIREPLLVIVYLCIALAMSWRLTLLSFLVTPFTLIIISWLGMKLHREGDLSQKLIAELTSLLQETISGIKVVHSFGMEKYEIDKFEGHTRNYFKSILKITHIRNLFSDHRISFRSLGRCDNLLRRHAGNSISHACRKRVHRVPFRNLSDNALGEGADNGQHSSVRIFCSREKNFRAS